MRKYTTLSAGMLACLAALGVVRTGHAADWIQQNRWIVAGPYTSAGCGPAAAVITQTLMEDCNIDETTPIAGDPSPNAANFKTGAWPLFDTWQSLKARGVGASDIVNLNDSVFGSDPNQVYAVAVIYANNKTGAPIDITFCMSSDDAIGVVLNDTQVWSNSACRGVGGCDDRADATLLDGVNKIAVAAYDDGGGWGFRMQLLRRADGSAIDDTEAPDVAFDIDPNGVFDQTSIKRTASATTCPPDGKVTVNLKDNGVSGRPDEVLTLTARVSGVMKVSGITGGGTFAADVQTPFATPQCQDGVADPQGIFEDHIDVGAPEMTPGSTSFSGGEYTIAGAGRDIHGGADEMHYAFKKVSGDFEMVAHIKNRDYTTGNLITSVDRWGRYGIMARLTCDANSPFYMNSELTPDGNPVQDDNDYDSHYVTYRANFGEGTPQENGNLPPYHPDWQKVVRKGNIFEAYASHDGKTWGFVHSRDFGNQTPDTVLLGLAVSSHQLNKLIAITFDQVSITTSPASAQSGTITWANKKRSEVDFSFVVDGAGPVNLGGSDSTGFPVIGVNTLFLEKSAPVGPDWEGHMNHGLEIGGNFTGNTTYDADTQTYTQVGSGYDYWSGGDTGQFAWRTVEGDFDLQIEVLEHKLPHRGGAHGRVGLMARKDCSTNSKNSFMCLSSAPNNEVGNRIIQPRFQQRWYDQVAETEDGQIANMPGNDNQPPFVRLVRHGQVFTGYVSYDGASWLLIGSDHFSEADSTGGVQVGVAVGRHGSHNGAPAIKYKVTEFKTGDIGIPPPISDDGGEPALQYAMDGTAAEWQFNKRDGAFTPLVVGDRIRMNDNVTGESTTAFNTAFWIPDIDSQIYSFDFNIYMGPLGTGHADGTTFCVVGATEENLSDASRLVGYGGGAAAWHGINGQPAKGGLIYGFNGFAVEFDTWQNGNYGNDIGNSGCGERCDRYHIGIDPMNNVGSVVVKNWTDAEALPDVFAAEGIHARVTYNRGKVEVFVRSNSTEDEPLVKVLEATVQPISFGGNPETAVFGFSGGTGGVAEIFEFNGVEVSAAECNDIPDVAKISGAPTEVNVNDEVTLGSDGSSPGAGDTGTLTYKWAVTSGAATGSIVGSDTGSTVKVKAGSAAGVLKVKLVASDNDGCSKDNSGSAEVTINVKGIGPAVNWVRGDTGDANLDITDAVNSLSFQFTGGAAPDCVAALDFNDDSLLDISDPVALLGTLFLGAEAGPNFGKCEKFDGCPTKCPQ